MQIEIINLGLKDYSEAFLFQEELTRKRSCNEIKDHFILCSHPSVVTLGRGSKEEEDISGWKGEVIKTNRGGRATYHGPGQIIGYPIFSLKEENQKNLPFKAEDIKAYLTFIENVLIKYLKTKGLKASARSLKPLEPGQLNRGVWIQDKKIASIGIAVKSWCTMHGFALNIRKDLKAFRGIQACGFSTDTYTSLEEQGVDTSYEEALEEFKHILEDI